MSISKPQSIPLCPVDQIPFGLGRAFHVGGKSLGVFRNHAGQVFAVDNACPRNGGPLTDGMIVGDQILCPLHAYRCDEEAEHICPSGSRCPLVNYPVEIEGNMILVGSNPL